MRASIIAILGLFFASSAPICAEVIPSARLAATPAGYYFEQDRGQPKAQPVFVGRDGDWTIRLRGLSIEMSAPGIPPVTMRLAGASRAEITGVGPLPGVTNRYQGNDPAKWIVGACHFASVRYARIYPGIDMVVHSRGSGYEYEFDLAPGADPSAITLSFGDRAKLSIDSRGDLLVLSDGRVIRNHAPRAAQEGSPVDVRFAIRGTTARFQIGSFDRARPLVIDPALEFSSYLGGSTSELVADMEVDSSGNIYILGSTQSVDFPMTGGTSVDPASCDQYYCKAKIFVTKFDPTGSTILYSTLFGGSGGETAGGLFVDSSGNAWITGTTNSATFPTMNPYQATYGGAIFYDGDAFVTKLDSSGAITWSTYLGKSNGDAGIDIAVDNNGSAYVFGRTQSYNFPITPGAFQTSLSFGGRLGDAFVTKFAPDGQSLAYSTFLGGGSSGNYEGTEWPGQIAVDSDGFAYVDGRTESPTFPVANAIQPTHGGGPCTGGPAYYCLDAFVTKLNQTGTALVYSTFLGGSSNDGAYGLTIDSSGAVYVAGSTASPNFPVKNAYQASLASYGDAFVTKINPAGDSIVYSTLFGGSSGESADRIAVNAAGEIHIAGTTRSTDLPTKYPFHGYKGDPANCYLIYGADVFVTKFNAAGDALVFSSYLGGIGADEPKGIALGGPDVVYVAGQTCSSDFPTVLAYQSVKKGTKGNAFFAKLNLAAPSKGDVNADGSITPADVFYLINFLFAGGPAPIGVGDVNGDGSVTAADVFYLVSYLLAGGPGPV